MDVGYFFPAQFLAASIVILVVVVLSTILTSTMYLKEDKLPGWLRRICSRWLPKNHCSDYNSNLFQHSVVCNSCMKGYFSLEMHSNGKIIVVYYEFFKLANLFLQPAELKSNSSKSMVCKKLYNILRCIKIVIFSLIY